MFFINLKSLIVKVYLFCKVAKNIYTSIEFRNNIFQKKKELNGMPNMRKE